MRSVDIVSQCENYFNGFQDIQSEKNEDVLKGVLKIFSYLMMWPLLLVGAIYLYNRKLAIIETKLDRQLKNLDPMRVNSLYQQANGQEVCVVTQKELTEYLIDIMENIDTQNAEMIERFQKGFKFLTPEGQSAFFQGVYSTDVLRKVFDMLPRNLEELHLSSGTPNAILYRATNCENAELIMRKLKEFPNLKSLSLDFRGVGFFSPRADSDLKFMTGNNCMVSGADIFRSVEWMGQSYYYDQDTFHIISSLKTLRDHLRQHPDLKYGIRFMNISVWNEGVGQKGSGGAGVFKNSNENEFSITIHNYLDTPVS